MARQSARAQQRQPAIPPAVTAKNPDLAIDLEGVYSEETLSPALERLYGELGGGHVPAYVVVHKKLPDNPKETRVWQGSPEEYDLDKLAKRFGTADYVVRIYVQGEGGRYHCRGCSTFAVELDPADEARLKAEREGKTLGGTAAPAETSIAEALSRALEQQQKNLMLMLAPILQQTADRKNALGDLKELATVLGIVRPAAATPAADPLAMLGMFGQLMKLVKDMTPERAVTEDEVGPNTLLLKGLELFTKTMDQAKAAPPALPPGEPPIFAPAAPIAGPMPANPVPMMPVEQATQPEEDGDMLMMKMQLKILLSAARSDADVAPYADIVYEQAPDEILDKLETAEWFAELVAIEPQCAQFQPWFTKCRDAVLEMLKEDGAGK